MEERDISIRLIDLDELGDGCYTVCHQEFGYQVHVPVTGPAILFNLHRRRIKAKLAEEIFERRYRCALTTVVFVSVDVQDLA